MIKVLIADDQELIRQSLSIILGLKEEISVVGGVGDGTEIKIIVLTTFDDDKYVFSALKYGASGYLLKGISVDELEKAIHVVYSGGAMINPEIASKVVELFSEMAQQNYDVMIEAENIEKINDMEWDIIKDVGHGMSNKEIADHIGLTEGTVRNYISTILKKIGLRDRTQLAIWEVQSGAQKRRG